MIKNIFYLFISLLVFFFLSHAIYYFLPGNPLDILFLESGIPSLTREPIPLENSFIQHCWVDFKNMLFQDFGKSLITQNPIYPMIVSAFFITLQISTITFVFSFFLSFALGLGSSQIYSPKFKFVFQKLSYFLSAWTAAVPLVLTAPILIYLFSIKIPLFEVTGSFLLCSFSLSLFYIGLWSRMIHKNIQDNFQKDFTRYARAKGLSEFTILIKYGFFPSASTLFGIMGTHLGGLFAGSFVAEIIFNLHGLGTLFIDSILSRDYPVLQKSLFLTSTLAFLGTFLGKMVHSRLDPRDLKS